MPRPAETADPTGCRPSAFVVWGAVAGIVGLTGIAGCSSGSLSGPPAAPPPAVTSAASPPAAPPPTPKLLRGRAVLSARVRRHRVPRRRQQHQQPRRKRCGCGRGQSGAAEPRNDWQRSGRLGQSRTGCGGGHHDLATALGSLQSTITSLDRPGQPGRRNSVLSPHRSARWSKPPCRSWTVPRRTVPRCHPRCCLPEHHLPTARRAIDAGNDLSAGGGRLGDPRAAHGGAPVARRLR